MEKGFEEKSMFGEIVYVKGQVAILKKTKWIPCHLKSGEPLSTNLCVDTWEELEKLMQEGGIK